MTPKEMGLIDTPSENITLAGDPEDPGEEVVVSGISGSFPDCDGVYMFRDKLMNKVDLICDDDRRWTNTNDPECPQRTGKIYNIEKFDAGFFGMQASQADVTDPLFRVAIERIYESILDAGVNPMHLRGTRTAVYAGSCISETERHWWFSDPSPGIAMLNCMRGSLVNRVSYFFGLEGPNCSIDTACSSSLVALNYAVDAIRAGKCDSAIVYSTQLCLNPVISKQFFRLGVLSPDGICRCFDSKASGYARAEGIAALFLQRAKDAKRVYARVVHSKVNCDGFKEQGITFPSRSQQFRLLKEFYEECKVDPRSIGYVEAHATATKAGDPEECSTLDKIFCTGRKEPLYIGSVKSNMGHAEPASGLCSAAKVIIALETGIIPPNINYSGVPKEDVEGLVEGRLKVVTEPTPFPDKRGLVGINSFGFGGVNVHTLFEWNMKVKKNGGLPSDNIPRLVTVAGRHAEAVTTILDDVKSRPLDAEFVQLLNDLFSDPQPGHDYRGFAIYTVTGEKVRDIAECDWVSSESPEKQTSVFVPGLGGLIPPVARSLLKIPPFSVAIEAAHTALLDTKLDVMSFLTEESAYNESIITQIVGTVAFQIGVLDCLACAGVNPDTFIGYSIGELASAYATRHLTLEQAIRSAYFIGKSLLEANLMNTATLTIGLNENHVASMLPPDVEITAVNGKNQTTVVGPVNFIKRLRDKLTVQGVEAHLYQLCGVSLHSSYSCLAYEPIKKYLEDVITISQPRRKTWVSSAERDLKLTKLCSPEFFARLLTKPLIFKNETVSDSIVIDVGPFNSCRMGSLALSSEHSADNAIHFLSTIGKLYLQGVEVTLSGLYPRLPYPVSRSTPMIAPLIRWDHSKDYFWPKASASTGKKGAEADVTISLQLDKYSYIAGHKIDGRILYPATGYIHLVIEVMRFSTEDMGIETVYVFRNVQFHRATTLSKNAETHFIIGIQKTTGQFEITEGGVAIVTGTVESFSRNEKSEMADASALSDTDDKNEVILSQKDIYKELRLRGYHYSGVFRGLTDVVSSGKRGKVSWNGNLVSFMDTMLQMQILSINSRDLYVPIAIGKIVVDLSTHTLEVGSLRSKPSVSGLFETVQENVDLPVHYYEHIGLIKSGGIEIWNLRAQQIPRRKPLGDAVLEKYAFAPGCLDLQQDDGDFSTVIRLLLHLALENLPGVKVKVLEIADENLPLVAPLVVLTLGDLPLIQAEVQLAASSRSKHVNDLPPGIKLLESANAYEKDYSAIIGKDLLSKKSLVAELEGAIKPNGYLITRDHPDSLITSDTHSILAQYIANGEKFTLLRKKVDVTLNDVAIINLGVEEDFAWIKPLKEALESPSQRVILVSEKNETSGILGLTNCLLKEPSGMKVRCFFIKDKNAPPFDLSLPLYSDQLGKNLVINVFENGEWGTYRHYALTGLAKIPSYHVYVNNSIRGDISSLNLFQGNLNKRMARNKLDDVGHVKVAYAAVNFKDVMVTSGKIVLPSSSTSNTEMQIGFEYSGITDKGERIFGMCPSGAMTSIITDKDAFAMWPVPENMSLAEAATIPVVYGTAYASLVRQGRARRGESVLIHSATGGVGLAAINISLGLGLDIFVTVGTKEKVNYLRTHFPQIPESHIGNSRDTSFEAMVKRETNGRGVDLVLNSLADEKFQASIRCLAPKGRFLEIGKYDLLKNSHIDMEPFREGAQFHVVMLDVLLDKGDEVFLESLVQDCLEAGFVKPLPRTVFDITEPEKAFRFMTTGNHIGKVLMKVLDEDELLNTKKQFPAVPRYFSNPERTYIIIGGLGGFGLELAGWLVIRGARSLVITSRSGVKNGYQGSRIKLWRDHGVNVKIATDDISTEEGVKKLLIDAASTAPVAGIFNLAVVLKDSVFENQTEETFRTSFDGKAKATQLLDKLSRELCPHLEDFVVFSSVSCGRGNAGQTNYGMANSVMERICERRKADGLPALAVQWGAVGEVGLVADMAESNLELVIGGTLQQTISSCLEALDTFLVQDSPVVASMVVAEKRSLLKAGATMVEAVSTILGIKDLKTLSTNAPLPELGMDSMTGVEIKQTLERDFEVFLTAQDLRSMTFGKLAALDAAHSPTSQGAASAGTEESRPELGLRFLVKSTPLEHEARVPAFDFETRENTGQPVIFIPGIDGLVSNFTQLAKELNCPAISLRYPHDSPNIDSIQKTARYMLSNFNDMKVDDNFKIVGYSAGGLVAIELANLMEKQGVKGHVILIDGAPAMVANLTRELGMTDDPDLVDNAVLLALQENVKSMSSTKDKEIYSSMHDREEKLDYLESISSEIGESSGYSLEYLRACAVDLMQRVQNVVTYTRGAEKLSSKITLIKPSQPTTRTALPEDFELSELTEEAVEIITIHGHHLDILESPEISETLNKLLSS